jgi:hypothetical protein
MDLIFLPGHAARVISRGFVLQDYAGMYAVNDQAEITVRFPIARWGFPAMVLRRDSTSLLLLPKACGSDSCDGGADPFGPEGIWPFRQAVESHRRR